ncbi:DUF1963 domain-containing protein [Pigmentiphaga aceris]|uniref:DUF1963 domain-containing protein n=1 Tax=Pigmentiphaga aceris TaxID=1940612 RepID=A0A5C0B2P6_9BURK|nr:YwqG family protein [Pigmentiphaga aceris]QEI08204.1 DUF1963 domain-containing protein [Pigmentiphaga aceris]
MNKVKTDTFSIDIPDIFESVRPILQSVRAQHALNDDMVTLTVGVANNSLLKKKRGADLGERFRTWCLDRRGPSELTEAYSFSVDDRVAHVVTVEAETGYAFYFAMVEADEGYHYELTGDCLVGQEDEYFPVFEQVLRSFRGFGDVAAALAEQQQGLKTLMSGQRKQKPAPEPEPSPAAPFVVPADGKEYLVVGGHAFTYLPETEYTIPAGFDTGSELSIDLKARIDAPDAAPQILNDYEDGQIYLRFSVKGIYHAGIPTGRFTFENDRDPTYLAYLWKGGFQYSLNLYGELVLEDGWVGFSGYFQGSEPTERHVVQFAKRLPLDTFDWTQYCFRTLDELYSAPVDLPRHLQVTKLGMAELPQALFQYTALESLSIACQAEVGSPQALQEIPDDIARLQNLKYLAFTSITGVKQIPAALAELRGLQKLYLTLSQITSIPEAVLALPELEYCVLSHNHLAHLPAHITPSLRSLSVDDNQLATLPEVLAELPALKYLNIKRNPLVSLPAGLANIEDLALELEKKQTLLDYRYPGADGQGTIPFDNDVFLARHDPALLAQLDAVLADEAWEPYREAIRDLALRTIALETTEPDDYSDTGNTRFGGLPDLPANVDYPTFANYQGETKGFQFIAQLNCADLAAHQAYLPRSGTLYFFISGQESIQAHVIHVDGDNSLRSASELSIDEDFIDADDGIYPPFRVAAAPWVSVPSFYSTESFALAGGVLDPLEEEYELTEGLTHNLEKASPVEPTHGVNSYVFMQHDTPQIEAANALKGKAEDFMVLLRVSSDRKPGFCFWDAGEIFFVIHKSDLARGDFSNVYCGLESS